jgi:hypothetical protein
LILDCLRPILDATELKEGNEAGVFLVAFDALLKEAGIAEAGIAHHMGHVGERSRGDSRLRDWPDAEWRLVRHDPDDPASPRYFSAYGRDVDQPEQLVSHDAATEHLTITGGSRKDERAEELIQAVVEYVTGHDGCPQVDLEGSIPGRADVIRAARDVAVRGG